MIDNDDAGRFSERAQAVRGHTPLSDLDEMKYRPYLDGLDLTDAEAREHLAILHDIMCRFVHLGWDVNLVCEYVFAESDLPAKEDKDAL